MSGEIVHEEDVFVIGIGPAYETFVNYINLWKTRPEIWRDIGFGRPVNKILVIVDPLMRFESISKNLASRFGLSLVVGRPTQVLESLRASEAFEKKVLVFTDYPKNKDDVKALEENVNIVERNKNLFLMSLAKPNIDKTITIMFDDVIFIYPPGEPERRKIFQHLLGPLIRDGKISIDVFNHLVMITEGLKTFELVTLARRLIAKSLCDGKEITHDTINSTYSQYLGRDCKRSAIKLFDSDILDQFYQMAIDENERRVFELINKLNNNTPLSFVDQQLLARYPFLLVDPPRKRLARFLRAKKIVESFKGEQRVG